MEIRMPVVAGQFYPADPEDCLQSCQQHLQALSEVDYSSQSLIGGVVPHAGWVFSGDCVGVFFRVLQALRVKVETFVVFGAAHRYARRHPAVGLESAWRTPLGDMTVDEEVRQAGIEAGLWDQDAQAHTAEHSIEVLLPFIKYCYPDVKILPILTPPAPDALACGAGLSRLMNPESTVLLASTDLTHYGPGYGFVTQGLDGWTWARDENDAAFLEDVTRLDGPGLLHEAQVTASACGAGAVAAAVACAQAWGANSGTVLKHTTSNDVLLQKTGRCGPDSVGYATVVFS